MESNYCVYKHTNKLNNECYIGITNKIPPSIRWGENGKNYRISTKTKNYTEGKFYNAILYYGWMNFEHEILEENLSKIEAEEKECYYIDLYDSLNNGYNDAYGYKGNVGKSWKWNISDKRRKEISESKKGNQNNLGKTWKQNISEERKEEIRNIRSNKVICDGVEYTNIGECSKFYGISEATMFGWLNSKEFKLYKKDRDYFLNELKLKYKEK